MKSKKIYHQPYLEEKTLTVKVTVLIKNHHQTDLDLVTSWELDFLPLDWFIGRGL